MTNGIGQHVQHLIEDALRNLLQSGIPGSAISGQLIAGSGGPLPPGGNTGSGYTPGAHSHPLAELDQDGASDGDVITWDAGAGAWVADAPAGGVSSVGLVMPSALFDVAGSPITTTGTLTVTLDTQSASTFFAGPTSGGAAAPAFRPIIGTDIPLNANEVAWGAVATDTLTSSGGLTFSGGSAILTIGEGLNVGTSAPVVSAGTRRYIAMRGVSDASVFEGSSGAADADNLQVAQFIAADKNSIAADKRLGGMTVSTSGTTATNRGGAVAFYTKADNASGMNFRGWIDSEGRFAWGHSAALATFDIARGTAAQGALKVQGTTYHSHFSYSTAEDTYIRGGKSTSRVYIADAGGGGVSIAAGGGNTTIGSTATPGRTLTLDNGTNVYISWAVAGVEKWVMGNEVPPNGDRLVIYNPTLASYSMLITRATDRVAFNGVVASGSYFHIGTTPVLGARITGWGAATNTTSRATFDTTTVTLPQLASRVGALINDLRTHGMIGA